MRNCKDIKMRNYQKPNMIYYTNCTQSTAEAINNMVDNSQEISYKTFLKYVTLEHILEIFPQYAKTSKQGLTIKNDYAVSFYKSIYKDCRCVYVYHSAIEYIFLS